MLSKEAFLHGAVVSYGGERNVRKHSANVLLGNQSIAIEVVHFKYKFELFFEIAEVDATEAVEEFALVNELVFVCVNNAKKAVANETWQIHELVRSIRNGVRIV